MASPFVLLFVVLGPIYAWKTGAWTRASDVQVADPVAAVREARRLIHEFRGSAQAEERARFLKLEDLPESLRLPKLRFAYVSKDHLNLVLGRNPDWQVGARIWSADATTVRADEPTAYPDIFFFDYSNDLPLSPENLP